MKKIVVDFIRAGQEWDPSTGRQENYIVLGFGGREFRFEVTEAELESCIEQSVRGASALGDAVATDTLEKAHAEGRETHVSYVMSPGPAPRFAVSYDEIPDDISVSSHTYVDTETGDEVFGGDVVAEVDHSIFERVEGQDPKPVREKSPTELRREQIAAARKRENHPKTEYERLQEMRERAKRFPPRKVSTDEAGYPIPPQRRVAVGEPEVEHVVPATQLGADDDGFEQG